MIKINYKIQGNTEKLKHFVDAADWSSMSKCVKGCLTMYDKELEDGNGIILYANIPHNNLLPPYMNYFLHGEDLSKFEEILSAECKKFNVTYTPEPNPITSAIGKIGFTDIIEARKCVAWLHDTYQVSPETITPEQTDEVKMYIIIPWHMAIEVRNHFAKFIV